MKQILLFSIACLFGIQTFAQSTITTEEKNGWLHVTNNKVQLGFNLRNGLFYIKNDKDEKVIDVAYFQCNALQSKDSCQKISWQAEKIADALGTGKTVTITVAFKNYADILWQVSLYDNREYIVFNMGVDNDTDQPYRLMNFYPLVSKQAYKGKNIRQNYRVLDGNGGGSPTWVTGREKITSFNNILVRFGDIRQPEILVAGGLSYHEFEKFVRVLTSKESMQIALYSEDPVGRLIDARQKYMSNEKFYLCFNNENPFEALEKYADALKKVQQIELNYYDFPTECLWYAAFYNNDTIRTKFNNTKGAVEEMDNAIKSGITRYTKVAIRLVPDAYGPNNQQGWWDDKHWSMYNERMSTNLPHYTEPYLTTESWCKAIIDKGGYPFTYMQSGRRSEDFVKLHPDWMLFNDPYRPYTNPRRLTQEASYPNMFSDDYSGHWWSDRQSWGYDFTDVGFIKHMQQVYAHLKQAGIKGIFYDYPEPTAWAYEGGFENPYATTAWAYRQMFQLAKDGLDKGALLQERNVIRGSDITLGLVASQRVWGDTDGITPEMVSRCGLRWYKNRTVVNYDMDSKDPSDALPVEHSDGNRSMLTMCYVTSSRFLLGRSFVQLSKEQLHDLSRIFPYHTVAKSARPIDAFDEGVKFPRVYDFEVTPGWHQLTFYNHRTDTIGVINVDFGKSLNEGGLGLDNNRQYYVYDFWNDRLVGLLHGNDRLEQTLRPGESRMMAVHCKEDHPQFISTNRHIMQGMLELSNVSWDAKNETLSGVASVVGGDSFVIIIALNGYKVASAKALQAKAGISALGDGLVKLTLDSKDNALIKWSIQFK